MEISGAVHTAVFIRRDNRFTATVKIGHYLNPAFVPNSGRLEELLRLGREVLVECKGDVPGRKTSYEVIFAKGPKGWVSVDSRVPNKLFLEAFREKKIPVFWGYQNVKPEVSYKRSRLDFCLWGLEGEAAERKPEKYYLEVKSVTLVKDGRMALFPDAPTERGVRHLEDLIEAKKEGYGAGILFCIQRPDALYFSPYDENDPLFGNTLRAAKEAGVNIMAYRCLVDEKSVIMDRAIPVRL
jgi:sugar fermentation stimulation protein A